VLPQGAPTSPAISNLCCRRLDARLSALAKRYGGVYTRYADDLTLSFAVAPENLGRVLWWVNCICQQEGFFENAKKRSIMRRGGRQSVTGLTVNQKVTLSRDDRRRFKAILNNCKRHGVESQARGRENFRGWLEGYAAFAQMVQPELGAKWLAEIAKLPG
jgi:RNA-directed DNA polymerase